MSKSLSFLVLSTAITVMAATATLQPSTTYQTIHGFGGGTVYYTNWLTAHPERNAIYDTMFTGLGLSYLRLGNWNQDTTSTLVNDSIIVAEGRKRLGSRFKILVSSWSAPGFLKVSGQVDGSINNVVLAKSQNTLKKVNGQYVYADYAHWWKRTVQKFQSKGMAPDVISIQNEPDMNATYAATIFAATQSDTLAGYPQALKAVYDSIQTLATKPQIYGPEVLGIGYNNFQNYANAMDRSLVNGYNYHLYHGSAGTYTDPDGFNTILNTLTTTYTGKPWMMSEYCPMRSTHPATDMLYLVRLMHNMLTRGNISSYINWELMWGDGGQMVQVDNPWTKGTWQINPEYHGIRHYSKFTGPGWLRVGASSDDSDVRVVAFKSPDSDSLTLVAINLATSAKTLNFDPAGYSYVSDAWQSSVAGPMSARLAFTASTRSLSLPASSVTTIVFVPNPGTSSVVVSSSTQVSSSSTISSSSVAVARAPFAGVIAVPGTLQVENYDLGGEGVAFHDADTANQGNAYRTDAVDIAGNATDGYSIAWTAAGEWLEYTVNVTDASALNIIARVATAQETGSLKLSLNGTDITPTVMISSTGDWNTYAEVSLGQTTSLSVGQHTLRLTFISTAFNLDWIRFESSTPTLHAPLKLPSPDFKTHCKVFNWKGKQVHEFSLQGTDNLISTWESTSHALPKGSYLVQIYSPQGNQYRVLRNH